MSDHDHSNQCMHSVHCTVHCMHSLCVALCVALCTVQSVLYTVQSSCTDRITEIIIDRSSWMRVGQYHDTMGLMGALTRIFLLIDHT